MKNNDILSKEIQSEEAEEALMLLKDVMWSRLLTRTISLIPTKGFGLNFHFDPTNNPCFENSVLTKTYHMAYGQSDYSEPLVEKAFRTENQQRGDKYLIKIE